MEAEEIYQVWAPSSSVWSGWVAPALFVQLSCPGSGTHLELEEVDLSWFPNNLAERIAIILDLPGAKSIRIATRLAVTRGLRPVPVINASPCPIDPASGSSSLSISSAEGAPSWPWDVCVVNMRDLVAALCSATPTINNLQLEADAQPVFVLDDARVHGHRPADEGMFDNRWMVFPQDFPSAAFLQRQGITGALLVQENVGPPREDLAHVLLRWQEAGIHIYARDGSEIRVQRPSWFRALWYRAIVILGLRRNSAGGFGSYIPESSSGG